MHVCMQVCCICRAPFTDPTTAQTCAHTFCTECILRALVHSPTCPVDRAPLARSDLAPANPIVRSVRPPPHHYKYAVHAS